MQWLRKLANEIQRENGLDRSTAARYAAYIGDTPIIDSETNRVLVINKETGQELATVRVPSLTQAAEDGEEEA